MDILPVDLHLLVQSLLFFAAIICGLIASVPTGLSKNNYNGHCILYGQIDWKNETYGQYTFSKQSTGCDFIIGSFVAICILYSLGMGCYYAYAVRKSVHDREIALQMWVMPFLLLNALATFIIFSAACVISLGFHTYCMKILESTAANASCKNTESVHFTDIDEAISVSGAQTYRYFTVAQIAAWIAVLIWTAQLVLTILRMVRNRRHRSRETFQGITTADTDKMASASVA